MEDICASAGSSPHQHGDSQSPCRSSRRIAGKSSFLSSRHIFAGPYPRWTGARLRSSRSLPGRLSRNYNLCHIVVSISLTLVYLTIHCHIVVSVRLTLIMAPLEWPGPVLDYFVDECFKMTLERSMSRQSFGTTFCKMDLIQQFRRILKNLELIKIRERQSQTCPDELGLKTGDIYASKFKLIRRYEIKLNTIFEKYYGSKAKSLITYRFNIEKHKRRSLGEPFSRQLWLKSSDMPESSQNGSASDIQDYDKSMGELIDKVDDGTYIIAGQCLRDPKILHSYSHIPTIERKISFLHGTGRVMCEPKCLR
ncbi:hypothetical protein BS78_01G264300, partial [Paspalum vaginatum]